MKPTRTFRTIRGARSKYKTSYYTTAERRDVAAQRDADRDNDTVIREEWSPDHSQDDLNRGWACVGTTTPTHQKEL